MLELDVEPGSPGWKCKCRDTFKGIYCSFTSSDYDPEKDLLLPDDASDTSMDSDDPLAAEETPCAGDNPCKHDGECFLSSHKSGYKCSCTDEWAGQHCTHKKGHSAALTPPAVVAESAAKTEATSVSPKLAVAVAVARTPTPPPTPTPYAELGKSHAQYGQEEFMFARYKGKIPSTFVEFGCRDGIEHSNTYALEASGWKGLCIEAIETVNPIRKLAYQGAICAPEMEGKTVTFDTSLPGLHGVKGTTDFSVFIPEAQNTQDKQVPCLSLPTLLKKNKMTHVGYMTVDLEGGEPAFIKHFDFKSFRIDVMQVECNRREICEQTQKLVEARGFKLAHKHDFSYPPTGGGDLLFENLELGKPLRLAAPAAPALAATLTPPAVVAESAAKTEATSVSPKLAVAVAVARTPTPPPTPTPYAELGKSHAQYGQEEFMFARYKGKIPSTFVEFGCRDGIEHSNTYALEASGWKGLCIEAIETVNPIRKLAYQGAICAPEMEGKTVTFDTSLPGLHGVKGTTDFSVFIPEAQNTQDKQVPCLSLPTLLKKNKMTHVGYMTVDLEGGEPAFIKHFDFKSFRIDVMQVECNRREICEQTQKLVEARGFKLAHKHDFSYPPTGGGDLLFENLELGKPLRLAAPAAPQGERRLSLSSSLSELVSRALH